MQKKSFDLNFSYMKITLFFLQSMYSSNKFYIRISKLFKTCFEKNVYYVYKILDTSSEKCSQTCLK